MGYVIAIDIGGTRLRAAAYAPKSQTPVQLERIQSHAPGEKVFDRLVALVQSVWPTNGTVEAIGVSAPGPLDPHSGVVMTTPNIKEWREFPLTDNLTDRFRLPAFLGNDANLAGLAEWKFGAGRGHHNVLYLTVSTGVGGGVIIDDRLLQGHHGLAAELGHVTVAEGGPICGCGFRGHLESFSSGTGIERFVADELAAGKKSTLMGKPSAKKIAEAALAGDRLARKAYARAGECLGIGVANYLHIFDPSIVILGGGVSMSGPLLFEPFEASLRKHVFHPRYLEGLEIKQAELGDDGGLLGALALARLKVEGRE